MHVSKQQRMTRFAGKQIGGEASSRISEGGENGERADCNNLLRLVGGLLPAHGDEGLNRGAHRHDLLFRLAILVLATTVKEPSQEIVIYQVEHST